MTQIIVRHVGDVAVLDLKSSGEKLTSLSPSGLRICTTEAEAIDNF